MVAGNTYTVGLCTPALDPCHLALVTYAVGGGWLCRAHLHASIIYYSVRAELF